MPRPMPELPGVDHRFVGVGEVTIHVAEAGDHTAEPLVLLHGWPQNWFAWRKVIGPLSETYRVICPDLRGFGWSSAPAGRYLKSELAADVSGLLDALGLERVRLGGHDWGGFIGFLLCTAEPERVTHFLAAGIGHPWVRPAGGPFERLRGLARLWYMFVLGAPLLGRQLMQRVPRLTRSVLTSAAADPAAWTAEELAVFVDQWGERDRAAAASSLYRTFLTRELPPIVRGAHRDEIMEQPAILLVGDGDPVIEAEALRDAGSNAPNLDVRELAGVGHWVPEEAPEATVAAMLELYAR